MASWLAVTVMSRTESPSRRVESSSPISAVATPRHLREREREREWMTNIDSAGQIAPYSARLTEPNQIEELTCRLDALRINYWAWQEWAVSCVNPESTRSL